MAWRALCGNTDTPPYEEEDAVAVPNARAPRAQTVRSLALLVRRAWDEIRLSPRHFVDLMVVRALLQWSFQQIPDFIEMDLIAVHFHAEDSRT